MISFTLKIKEIFELSCGIANLSRQNAQLFAILLFNLTYEKN